MASEARKCSFFIFEWASMICYWMLFQSLRLQKIDILKLTKSMSQLGQYEIKKSARFAAVDQVFNYTAQKVQDSQNSLLLTPRQIRQEDQALLSHKKSGGKERNSNRKGHQQVQQKRQSLIEKREKFRKRLSQLPANMQKECSQQNAAFQEKIPISEHSNQLKRDQGQKMDIQQPKQRKQSESTKVWNQNINLLPQNTSSTEQKTKLGFYSQVPQISKPKDKKLTTQDVSQLSTQNLRTDANQPSKLVVLQNQLKTNRVTMDCQSILKELGVLFEQNEDNQRFTQESQISKHKTELNESKRSKNVEQKQPDNLITRAYRRLSQEGRRVSMVKKKSRVTLNFNEIQSALADLQPNNAILIKTLKKETDDRLFTQKSQTEKQDEQTRRAILEKYINEEQMRQKAAKESCDKVKLQYQYLQAKIKKLDEIESQLNEKIRQKHHQSFKYDNKIDQLSSSIYSPEEVSQLLEPIYFLRNLYAVNIVQVISRNKGVLYQSKNFQIKFIIDQLVYCKLVSNEGEAKSLTFLSPTTLDKRINQWSIDLQLRQTLLRKFNQKALLHCEPIQTVMKLGGFWQSLEKIEGDFQQIDQIFDLLDLNLDEFKDQLSFKIQIKYNLVFEVRINFLNVGKQGYFSIHCEPQSKMSIQSKGHEQLLEFITAFIEQLN